MFFLASEAFSDLTVFKKSGTVFLYLTIGLIALVAVIGILIKIFKADKLKDFYKYTTGIGIGYSFALIGIMLFLKFDEIVSEGEFFPEIFWPIFGLLALVLALSFGGFIMSIVKKQYLNIYALISFALVAIYIIVYAVIKLSEQYKQSFVLSDEIGLILSTFILIALIALLLMLFGKKTEQEHKTKSIVYASVCIALSFALSYIRFFRLPQGGAITFVSALPLMIYSYMFGIRKGVLAGFIYGILQAIQDPWILHPIQFLLDYPIAFAMVGLAGIFRYFPPFKNKIILQFITGGIVFAILRYACHVITGIIVFDIYAAEGFNAVAWGFLYNLFVFADVAIALFAGSLMLTSKSFVKQTLSI